MKNKFKDFNFKLAVIDALMYEKGLLKPKFDVYEAYKKTHKGRKLDPVDNQLIPEAKKYFEELDIPTDLLKLVKELRQYIGSEAMDQVIPIWDGEGEEFTITSTADLKLVPNLKRITLFRDEDEKIANEFNKKGIKATYWP